MKINKILITILVAIILVQQAAALGITPGKKNIDFEPGKTQEVDITVINSEKEAKTVNLKPKGKLKNNIELSKNQVEFSKGEKRKSLTYTLNIPESLEEPGRHQSKIKATQKGKNIQAGETTVGSRVAVISKVNIDVPYPGKYLEILETKIESGLNESEFFIQLENKGQETIEQAKVTLTIKNPEGEEVKTKETMVENINEGKRAEANPKISGLETGKYTAEIKVNYAGNSQTSEKEFSVGQDTLSIKRMYVEDFELGEIAKFNSMVKNNYNTKIKNLQMNMTIYNRDSVMESIKSNTYTIPSESTKNIVSYWDTEGVEKGDYQGVIALQHSLGSFSKEVTFEVRSDTILVQGLGGEVIAEEVEDNNLLRTILIAAGALAILNLIYFGIRRLIKKKKGKKVKSLFSKK